MEIMDVWGEWNNQRWSIRTIKVYIIKRPVIN